MSGNDWRNRQLPDGRTVEFLRAEWEPDDGTEAPGTIKLRAYYLIDGALESKVVALTVDANGEWAVP